MGEGLFDALVDGKVFGIVQTAQVDTGGIEAVMGGDIGRIEGGMRLANGSENLAGLQIDGGLVDIAGGDNFGDVVQVAFDLADAFNDKLIGLGQVQPDRHKFFVQFQESLFQLAELFVGIVGCNKIGVNSGGLGLFIFQQPVGHAAVSGDHKNTVVGILAVFGQNNIPQDILKTGHGCSADFFDR